MSSNPRNWPAYDRCPLTAKEARVAEQQLAQCRELDRQHFLTHDPVYYVRPTRTYELRAIMHEWHVNGVPAGLPKWLPGLAVMHQQGDTVERRFVPFPAHVVTREARDAHVNQFNALVWWMLADRMYADASGAVFADAFALGPSA